MRNLRRAGALQVLVWIILLLPGFVRADFDIAAELYRQKNYVSAFDAFQDLAKKGDPRAKTVLALMHKFGEGTQQDLSKSFNWYHSAAEQGYPPAQFHTGIRQGN